MFKIFYKLPPVASGSHVIAMEGNSEDLGKLKKRMTIKQCTSAAVRPLSLNYGLLS
jgi:hypothetical protein